MGFTVLHIFVGFKGQTATQRAKKATQRANLATKKQQLQHQLSKIDAGRFWVQVAYTVVASLIGAKPFLRLYELILSGLTGNLFGF